MKVLENQLIKLPEKDFWDDLSDEDKKAIDRGLADVEANRVKSYKDVMKQYISPTSKTKAVRRPNLTSK